MTEFSGLWTTGSSGDGASTYTRTDWSTFLRILAACMDDEGVAPAYLNACIPTTTGANNARIGTGGGVVDGKVYSNSAAVDVVIPSASGGGNTRIDRVVLRANWTAQTVRVTLISGTDAASPTAPTITQTSGTTYDILLCQALVDTGGTVTITDERTFARPGTDTIATAAYRDASITFAKFGNLAALSVMGRAANSSGVSSNIAATAASGAVLRESGSELSFGTVATAGLAANSVDETIIGDGVPGMIRRLGGSATDWTIAGSTSRVVSTVRMVAGCATGVSLAVGAALGITITFPITFAYPPLVFVTCDDQGAGGVAVAQIATGGGTTTTQVSLDIFNVGPGSSSWNINWLAIGPE